MVIGLTIFFKHRLRPACPDYRRIQIFETIRNLKSYKRLDADLGDVLP